MSPMTDPSLPVYARAALSILFIATVAALLAAVVVLIMSADHPASLVIRIGATLAAIAVGRIWGRRRSKNPRPL